jgi:ankyrin repeat protein
MLLNRGVDPNTRSDWVFYGTALQEASAKGHEDIVKILLCGGAGVNAGGKFKTFPLINGSGERRNADEFSSALHAASANGHYRIVKMLLDAGAQRHQQDDTVPALEDFSDEA